MPKENQTKKEKKEYWFDPEMKWRTFKLIMDKLPKDGIFPMHIDKILWQMLRDRKINILYSPTQKDDPIKITTKQPPKRFYKISTPKSHERKLKQRKIKVL